MVLCSQAGSHMPVQAIERRQDIERNLRKVQAFEYGGTVLRAILVWEFLLQWSVGKLQTHETVPARRMRAKFGESCPLLCQQVESERNSSATASRDHRPLMVHGLQGVILLCGSLLARPCHINP